jgi:hypothetical protein
MTTRMKNARSSGTFWAEKCDHRARRFPLPDSGPDIFTQGGGNYLFCVDVRALQFRREPALTHDQDAVGQAGNSPH